VIHHALTGDETQRTVRLHLQGSPYTGFSRQDGTFVIHDVAPGLYILEVLDSQWIWPQLEIDVGLRESGAVHAFALGPQKEPAGYPLVLQPAGRAAYFETREGFKWRSLLANPMMITMAFSVISLFVLPKMIANMDPETLKEIQETQNRMAGGGGSAPANNEPAKRVTAK